MNVRVQISDSTAITEMEYKSWNREYRGTLTVTFKNGAKYEYSDVEYYDFARVLNAESIGSEFATEIKPYHKVVKV